MILCDKSRDIFACFALLDDPQATRPLLSLHYGRSTTASASMVLLAAQNKPHTLFIALNNITLE